LRSKGFQTGHTDKPEFVVPAMQRLPFTTNAF